MARPGAGVKAGPYFPGASHAARDWSGAQIGHGGGNTGQKSRHTQDLGQRQGTPQSESPPGPWELPVMSDMLLKDLNREETGVANETRDICPTSYLSAPANTDQAPGHPGHPGTRQGAHCFESRMACPSMLPPLTLHHTIALPATFGPWLLLVLPELGQPPHSHPCESRSLHTSLWAPQPPPAQPPIKRPLRGEDSDGKHQEPGNLTSCSGHDGCGWVF